MKSQVMFTIAFLLSSTALAGGSSIGQGGVELRPSIGTDENGVTIQGSIDGNKLWKVVSVSEQKASVQFAIAQIVQGKWSVSTRTVEASKVNEAALLRIQSGDASVYQWNKAK